MTLKLNEQQVYHKNKKQEDLRRNSYSEIKQFYNELTANNFIKIMLARD